MPNDGFGTLVQKLNLFYVYQPEIIKMNMKEK